MKQYDMKCPICGCVNRGLYLEETDGCMECEECSAIVRSPDFPRMIRLPILQIKKHSECRVVTM